tara:strand:+ start:744 stop:1010 length:267 start_codon:yes stop_codon:yes gene_type:complete
MSDAMNIKLTVADFEEMDANTLLGLHNKILESRDEALEERDAARSGWNECEREVDLLEINLMNEGRRVAVRDSALVEYALQNLLGDDA